MFYVARNRGLSYTRSPDAGQGVWNGSWHLVTGTYDGSSVRLYLDGNQVGNGTAHTGAIDYDFPDNDLFIGHYNTCPTEDFHGEVDSAQIYNRALTPSEIHDTYDQLTGTGGSGSPGGTGPGGTSTPQPGGSTPQSGGNAPSSSGSGTSQSGSVSGLSNGKPHLLIRVPARTGSNPIKSFTVILPSGLHFAQSLSQLRKGVSLAHRPKYSLSLRHGQLVVVFKRPQRSVGLTISGPALTETPSLVKRVQAIVKFNRTKPHAKKKVLELRLGIRLTDANAKSAPVHAVLRVS